MIFFKGWSKFFDVSAYTLDFSAIPRFMNVFPLSGNRACQHGKEFRIDIISAYFTLNSSV